jgi:hypothetical protein
MRSRVQTFTYEHPWELLVAAHDRRFPSHPRIPVMLRSRVLEERLLPSGVLYIKRECIMDVEAPMCVPRRVP